MLVIPTLERLRQEDCKLEGSLGYIIRSVSKSKDGLEGRRFKVWIDYKTSVTCHLYEQKEDTFS